MPDIAWLNYPVTHGYYATYDPNIADTPHYALDIGTPFHTPITAIESGTVIQADYAAWGGEIFVKPDNGSEEYYVYHLDQNSVSPGQHVNAGDLLGLSGGENPGYPGALHPAAPEWSDGLHTHIGLFTNWASTPIGTRPQGPDPSALIQGLKVGQVVGSTKGSLSTDPVTSTPLGGSLPTLPDVQGGLQSMFVRAGLFLVVLVVLGGGLYIAFKDQINDTAVTAARTVGKAAVLA